MAHGVSGGSGRNQKSAMPTKRLSDGAVVISGADAVPLVPVAYRCAPPPAIPSVNEAGISESKSYTLSGRPIMLARAIRIEACDSIDWRVVAVPEFRGERALSRACNRVIQRLYRKLNTGGLS